MASSAQFTHPVNESWIAACRDEFGGASASVLDYGCGYGRTLGVLQKLGFDQLYGVDPSVKMITRAKTELPVASFSTIEGSKMPYPAYSFSLVLLVAVLTCVPDSNEQRAIISGILRVIAPGGYVHVSDYLLQTDHRNTARYRHFAELGFRHGVFEIHDGRAVMRHHERDYLDELLAEFDLVEEREVSLVTMKGNPATGLQVMLRKPVDDRLSDKKCRGASSRPQMTC